jgi:16S rRNA (guanine1207-N2)-methyltransferase
MSASQYFEAQPDVASDRSEVTLALPDLNLRLTTDRGVFSHSGVDAGTRFLLQEAGVPIGENLLDLGCGYGPIAITMARRAPAAVVWAVDTNERAVGLCDENATANGCSNVRAFAVDDFPATVRFDTIWSNPPIRIGKDALHSLLLKWLPRLTPTGVAVMVVQKHLGADSLAHWLADKGYDVARTASRQGYRLMTVRQCERSADETA